MMLCTCRVPRPRREASGQPGLLPSLRSTIRYTPSRLCFVLQGYLSSSHSVVLIRGRRKLRRRDVRNFQLLYRTPSAYSSNQRPSAPRTHFAYSSELDILSSNRFRRINIIYSLLT